MSSPLGGKVSLVTGASRGIGAETALRLAQLGSDVILNYRSKGSRADEVAHRILALGRKALPIQADLTVEPELASMMEKVKTSFAKLDLLILNASGGLEKGKAEDYAMSLNRDAQLRTARLAGELMESGGRIVFVTSHWAHFFGTRPVIGAYEAVAESKRAGEDALRQYAVQLSERGISLIVVSGDAIEGTITPRLLRRNSPGLFEHRGEAEGLPTIKQFATAIVNAAADSSLSSGATIFVGSTDW